MNSARGLKILESAQKRSVELGVKMNIAVVDKGGNLVAFVRYK